MFGEYLEPPQSGEHYHIEQVGGPTVCFTPYNDTAQVRALRAGVYCFRVTLFDGEFVLQRIVYVPVYGPDEALALEEPEQPAEGYAGHEVHLNGPDGASHYLWVQLDGPACAKAHDSTGKTGSFYLPSSGEYTFMLYMSDGSSWTEPVSYKVNAVVGSPPSSGGGGCFVATAAFGSLTSDYVGALTAMRDGTLATSRTSSALVALYYSVSPAPSGSIRTSEPLRALLRDLLR
ncbi:MAG: CFI-box-CTERM domain-containing protein [Planctomycetota bacterium]|nr:CFI-box-CTERM domain-containing protein [Planctomycetota bacterium]